MKIKIKKKKKRYQGEIKKIKGKESGRSNDREGQRQIPKEK